MKKIIYLFSLILIVSLSSCDSTTDLIGHGTDFISTVIENRNNQYILELDGGDQYYTSELINQNEVAIKTGDRIYLQYFTVNYDKQPDGGIGTLSRPFLIESLVYNKIACPAVVELSEETNLIQNDTIGYICGPYLNTTTKGDTYLTMFCDVIVDTEPAFNLVYEGTEANVHTYEMKMTYTKTSFSKVLEGTPVTFKLNDLETSGKIKVNFTSKRYDTDDNNFIKDDYFTLTYTKKEVE